MVPCTKNRRIQKCKYKLTVKVSSFCSQTKRYSQCPVGGSFSNFYLMTETLPVFEDSYRLYIYNIMFGGKV